MTLLGACASRVAAAQPRYVVSLERVQQAVASRFPLRLDVAGLFKLDLQTPQLRLVPEQNRLRSEMTIDAAGEALRHRYRGLFDLDFLLRYEPSDLTLRAYRPRVHVLHLERLPPRPAELLASIGPALAEEALHDLPLHQLQRQDLALPDAIGLEPDTVTVTADGLVIGFRPKRPRAAP